MPKPTWDEIEQARNEATRLHLMKSDPSLTDEERAAAKHLCRLQTSIVADLLFEFHEDEHDVVRRMQFKNRLFPFHHVP